MVNVHLFPENLSLLYVCVKSMGVYDSVQTMFDCDFHENVRLDRIIDTHRLHTYIQQRKVFWKKVYIHHTETSENGMILKT